MTEELRDIIALAAGYGTTAYATPLSGGTYGDYGVMVSTSPCEGAGQGSTPCYHPKPD